MRKKLFLELFRDQVFEMMNFSPTRDLLTDLRRVAVIYIDAERHLRRSVGSSALENSLEYTEGLIMRSITADLHESPHTPRVFLMSEDFSSQLLKVDLKIAENFLPPVGWSGVIEFPWPFQCGRDFHRNAVVIFGRASTGGERTVAVLCPDYSSSGKILETRSILTIPIIDGAPIEDCIAFTESVNRKRSILDDHYHSGNAISTECMAFILKACTYIVSSHPDLSPLLPPPPPTTSKPKKIAGWLHENYPLPVARVGYSFHGDRIRHVGETSVRSHFRWQKFGPGLSQIKLIWIDEHTRHYKDFDQPSVETHPS